MPPNCQLCLSAHVLPVFTSDFLYPSLIHICLKSLSLPLTHPAHLNNPLTVFIHLFFSISLPFLVFSLCALYFTLLPVLAFLSPCSPCLSLLLMFFYLISPFSPHLPPLPSLLHLCLLSFSSPYLTPLAQSLIPLFSAFLSSSTDPAV